MISVLKGRYQILLSCAVAASQAQFPHHQFASNGPVQQAYNSAPPAPIGSDGSVVDTPEVAQAKAEHFAEYARAAARAAEDKSPDNGAYHQQPQYSSQPGPGVRQAFAYHGRSPAQHQYSHAAPAPVVQYQQQPTYQHAQPSPAYQQQAHFGPEAKAYQISAGAKAPFQPAPLAADGTVVDTPEVAALKQARLQELADAEARAARYGNDEYSADNSEQYNPAQYQSAAPIPRPSYPGAPSGAPQTAYQAQPGFPSGLPASAFSGTGRAYQPSSPIYQTQPQAFAQQNYQQPQSYQSQY
ncbi:skin secretory protein xP2-like isoform X1 [Trichogramma pretiosum]|uniref:skin secretory protein xP2-like isoform X1 n=1 Tax=Trichogramma pretiosum TaxID=7493 RepID=UPI0006C94D99|nr:skin secretory protein xP2-like isoform X1 [Trichogramma pretiosum]